MAFNIFTNQFNFISNIIFTKILDSKKSRHILQYRDYLIDVTERTINWGLYIDNNNCYTLYRYGQLFIEGVWSGYWRTITILITSRDPVDWLRF